MAADGVHGSYGGFVLGPMRLALPMEALREAVPCPELLPIPCPARCVIGAIDLRGTLIPVVDLRIALGMEVAAARPRNAVIMVHEGRLVGLAADQVHSIFIPDQRGLSRATSTDASAALYAGSLQPAGESSPVIVLNPAAVAGIAQLPLVDDFEPQRSPSATVADRSVSRAAASRLLLVSSGRIPLAIDALAVYATVSNLRLEPTILAGGHCLGVIEYAGLRIPAVDLASVCGFDRLQASAALQAFVIRTDAGMVACMVDRVIDVVSVARSEFLTMPPLFPKDPALFAGVLPTTRLPGEVLARSALATTQFYVIDGDALKRSPDVNALGQVNSPCDGAGQGAAGAAGAAGERESARAAAASGNRSMITYDLGIEAATPMNQVSRILPYVPETRAGRKHGALLGMVVDRDQAIPVVCLGTLLGLAVDRIKPHGSVLVVESGPVQLGFAVGSLTAIEPSSWEPTLPALSRPHNGALQALRTGSLAQVGTEGRQRLVRMLDLTAIAAALQCDGAQGVLRNFPEALPAARPPGPPGSAPRAGRLPYLAPSRPA